jgi:hypothetical protein
VSMMRGRSWQTRWLSNLQCDHGTYVFTYGRPDENDKPIYRCDIVERLDNNKVSSTPSDNLSRIPADFEGTA